MSLLGGATTLVELILKKFGDDTAGAAKELERLGGFPPEVSQRIASGELPMDSASVAKRKDEWGGDLEYHGTRASGLLKVDPDKVDLGLHTGPVEQADNRLKMTRQWADDVSSETIIPLMVRRGNEMTDMRDIGTWSDSRSVAKEMDNAGYDTYGRLEELEETGNFMHSDEWVVSQENRDGLGEFKDTLLDDGFDSIRYQNKVENDYGANGGLRRGAQKQVDALSERTKGLLELGQSRKPPNPMPNVDGLAPDEAEAAINAWLKSDSKLGTDYYGEGFRYLNDAEKAEVKQLRSEQAKISGSPDNLADTRSTISLRPENLRSPNAAFDPQYKGPNIMGGAAGTAGLTGLLAAGQSEDSEAGFITKGGKTLLEAWHGSPHKFDNFSMDAIGSGEGAQAYGHGLYFADSEDIAKGYRDALTEARFEVNGKVTDSVYNYDIEEKFADEFNTAVDDYADDWLNSVVDEADAVGFDLDQDMLSDFVRSAKNDFEDDLPVEVAQYAQKVEEATGIPIGDLAEELDLRVRSPLRLGLANMSQIGGPEDMGYVYDQLDEWGPFARDVFDRYIGENVKHVKPEGALYRTEIDVTPESLLDYDMPLQGQPQSIQDAFVNAYRGYANDGTPEGLLMSDLLEGSTPHDALNLFDESKGSQSYRTLADMVGGEDKASALLNEQGVRGIKFADGNSRKAKQAMVDGKSGGFEGDENYVIFDDSLINIAERGNADPRLLAGTAAGTAGLLALGASNDADAGVAGRVLAESGLAYKQLRKQVARNKQNGISPGNTVKQWVHDKKNTTYNDMGAYARKVDGDNGGEYYKQQTQNIVDQILEGVDNPDKDLMAGLTEWSGARQSRELGHRPDWQKGAATPGLLGATAAGTTGLLAAPALMKEGFPSWEEVSRDPTAPLPAPAFGEQMGKAGEVLMTVLDLPMTGWQGIARGLSGVMDGEDVVTAGAEANHMMNGGSEEGFSRLGDKVEGLLSPIDKRFPYLNAGKSAGDTVGLLASIIAPF